MVNISFSIYHDLLDALEYEGQYTVIFHSSLKNDVGQLQSTVRRGRRVFIFQCLPFPVLLGPL